jgi:hypothetical protein
MSREDERTHPNIRTSQIRLACQFITDMMVAANAEACQEATFAERRGRAN